MTGSWNIERNLMHLKNSIFKNFLLVDLGVGLKMTCDVKTSVMVSFGILPKGGIKGITHVNSQHRGIYDYLNSIYWNTVTDVIFPVKIDLYKSL